MNKSNNKAVLFTLDAILAVVLAGVMITASYSLISQSTDGFNAEHMYKMSLDALAVLEKDGTFGNVAQTKDPSALGNFLNAMPGMICGNLSVFDSSSALVASSQKSGCSLDNPLVSRRIFVASNFSPYYAEMRLAFD